VRSNKRRSSKKLTIITTAAIVVLSTTAIVGYGLYNGMVIRNYANSTLDIMDSSASNWNVQDIEENNQSLDDIIKTLAVTKADSETQLKKLEQLTAPNAATDLESKTEDYFDLAKSISTDVLDITDYAKALQITTNNINNVYGKATSVEQLATTYDQLHQALTQNIAVLEATTPSDGVYQEFSAQYISTLKEFDNLIAQTAEYANNGQIDQISALDSQFNEVVQAMSEIVVPDTTESLNRLASEGNRKKLANLPIQIRAKAQELANTIFSF
jgi:hypothetical protein